MALTGVVQKYQDRSTSASHKGSHGLMALRESCGSVRRRSAQRGRCQIRISGRVADRASIFDING